MIIYNLELVETVVSVNPKYYRPTEVDLLLGNPAKAKSELGWAAQTKWDELAKLTVKEDFQKVLKRSF